jgi:hypothetical protein
VTKLKLTRPPERAAEKTVMQVYINGNVAAQISNGETKEMEMSPGVHTIRLAAGSQGSKKYKLCLKENETKTLVLSTNNNVNRFGAFASGGILPDLAINGLMLLYYFTIGQNRYLKVSELSSIFR